MSVANVRLKGTFRLDATPGLFGESIVDLYCIAGALGLKLESTKGPVDVVVVDSVDKPTPD
jgi:hypothetical protein